MSVVLRSAPLDVAPEIAIAQALVGFNAGRSGQAEACTTRERVRDRNAQVDRTSLWVEWPEEAREGRAGEHGRVLSMSMFPTVAEAVFPAASGARAAHRLPAPSPVSTVGNGGMPGGMPDSMSSHRKFERRSGDALVATDPERAS